MGEWRAPGRWRCLEGRGSRRAFGTPRRMASTWRTSRSSMPLRRMKTVRQLFGLDDVTKKVDTAECSADRLQELIDSCDTKTKAQIAEGMDFLKVKGFEPEAAEAQVNAL